MSKTSARARRYFDARIDRLRLVADEPPPHQGWIRAIRECSRNVEHGARLPYGRRPVDHLRSRTERDPGTIKLDTLRRAAAALDCDLVYYLVPRTTLEDTAQRQARQQGERTAGRRARRPSTTMLSRPVDSARLDELALGLSGSNGTLDRLTTGTLLSLTALEPQAGHSPAPHALR